MVLSCMKFIATMAQAQRVRMIAKSVIFLVLLALAGIGIATGSERGKEGVVALRAIMAVDQDQQSFGGREDRVGTLDLRGIQG